MQIRFEFSILLFVAGSFAAPGATLFVVGVAANEHRTSDAIVYRADDGSRALKPVATLASDPDVILADLENSVIAAASPTAAATEVDFIFTGAPGVVQRVPVVYPAGASMAGEIELHVDGIGEFLGFAAGKLESFDKFVPVEGVVGVALRPGASSQILPLSALAQPRTEGLVGDPYPESSNLTQSVTGDPLRVRWSPAAPVPIGIPAPPDSGDFRLLVSNNEVIVVAPGGPPRIAPFRVYDRSRKSWKSFRPPFPTVFVRSFGYWLAFPEAEPAAGTRIQLAPGAVEVIPGGNQAGDASKRRAAAVTSKTSVEDEMLLSGNSHSGALYILNANTGAHFLIETGEADSEILLVDDSSVVYRVNDEIKQAFIVGGGLSASTVLASGPSVGGVHWAFWSGATGESSASASGP